ncbi:MAG TPA: LysR family transcriptional regulator [Candidatus Lachnoclostridium pullistercoris]|uniref:LysR family transcriptional regulator n=1 Tax=Candidatus Lachnoclostridium pullistercoris TaxID=2838632 RepID=A0A9D2PDG3_9FIRM|nr:LysR family transcriptional regulator [Candidatus Lachnoclostridium pullistercoris]
MNTFQLTCFMTVAETLNFARAAERLNITQPAVTHQIRSLEEELEVKLFKRTTRLVELTPSGYLFINDARTILETAVRAKKRFEDPGQQEMTELRIGSQSHTYLRGLADTLDRLRQAYPAVHPRFQSEPVPVLRRRVQEGDLDVLLDFREEDGEKRGIVYRELLKVPVVCLCPADHPLAAKTAVSQEDLKEEKLIVNGPMHSPGAVIRLQGEIIGKRSLTDVYFSDSPETAALLTLAGYGISFLPDLFLPRRERLVKRPLMGIEELSFGLYCRRGDANPVLKEFIRIVEDSL